jgi:hypothetical protein
MATRLETDFAFRFVHRYASCPALKFRMTSGTNRRVDRVFQTLHAFPGRMRDTATECCKGKAHSSSQ